MKLELIHPIETQPDCITCGPCALHSIYHHYQDSIGLDEVIQQVRYMPMGGTLSVFLGCHALNRGYSATLHSFNLDVIDPTWFRGKQINLLQKLKQQVMSHDDSKVIEATQAYIEFLELGGKINFQTVSFEQIQNYIKNRTPILSGINATYFYQTMRDYTNKDNRVVYDEWEGRPSGHFIVIYDYDQNQQLAVADPFSPHPLSRQHHYSVSYTHWLHAMLLGVLTYDAEFLIIEDF